MRRLQAGLAAVLIAFALGLAGCEHIAAGTTPATSFVNSSDGGGGGGGGGY
ncbi:MAG: hypothetical protein HY521_11755 [Proteobacteria bacterium]|nr:hypothetical protein [Pseudomonadota bacterium]